jgi:hypothetical protein
MAFLHLVGFIVQHGVLAPAQPLTERALSRTAISHP